MVKVKICGLTRVQDAAVALESGADYLGFILYPPSPRAVTVESLGTIVRELRSSYGRLFSAPLPPRLVGVFVNEQPAVIAEVLAQCGLDLAQLSGDEDAADIVDPLSPLIGRAYKAIRPRSREEAIASIGRYTNLMADSLSPQPSILLDTPHGKLYGGTGEVGDWEMSSELADVTPYLMLAGGLTADNVAEAVRQVQPFAVDVAGGVEERPGIKNHELLRAFIGRAKGIEQSPDGPTATPF